MAKVNCCSVAPLEGLDLKCREEPYNNQHVNHMAEIYIAKQEYLSFEKNKFDNISKWLKKKRDSYGNNI